MNGGVEIFREYGFQRFPGQVIIWMEGDHEVIEAGLEQCVEVVWIGQSGTIAEQPGDLAQGLGMGDQLGQVIPQGGFAAGEDDVWDTGLPGPIEDHFPLRGVQLAVDPFGGSHLRVDALR